MTNTQARLFVEHVLDTLMEAGNGITDEDLHEACNWLFRVRDEWMVHHCKHDVPVNAVRTEFGFTASFQCTCGMAMGANGPDEFTACCGLGQQLLEHRCKL